MLRTSLLRGLAPAALLLLSAFPALAAQNGQNDPSFNPLDNGAFGDGPNAQVQHIALQPDGKALIVGALSDYSGVERRQVARLHPDGTLDASFDPGAGSDGWLYALALQPDGKVLLGGGFTSFDSVSARGVVRLDADGIVDSSFTAGLGAFNIVTALALQPDGKVLVAGKLAQGSVSSYTVRRLLPSGALDAGFNAGASAGAYPRSLALQPDGKILVAGDFFSFGGVASPRIARLNADGSNDASFHPGSGPDDIVFNVLLQPDGRVLITGYFSNVSGVARNHVARLNSNGSLDASFDPGVGPNSWVRASALQPDGKLLLGGQFTQVVGQPAAGVARLATDGSPDPGFDSSAAANDTVWSVAHQADGKVLIGGEFSSVGGIGQRHLARLSGAGTHDISYNAGSGADNVVRAVAVQPDGTALVGGQFTRFNGTPYSRLVQLDSNGAVDPSFDPGTGVNFLVYALAHQPDGKALVVGAIWDYDGAPARSIVRVNSDGSRDTSFDAGSGAHPSSPFAVALQPDGRIVLGGGFTTFDGHPRGSVVRLLSDGSVDPSFTTAGGGTYGVDVVAVQPDGRILIGGGFTSYDGETRNSIARLFADGSLDMSFNPSTAWDVGALYGVSAIALQPDGKVLIGGTFTSYSGAPRKGVARLHTDGSLDSSFDPGAGVTSTAWPQAYVNSIALQPDGRVLVGGLFTHVGGVARANLARLDANGSVDVSFDPGPGANGRVHALAFEPHGRVWVGGEFTQLRGAPRHRVGRLFAYDAPPIVYCTAGTSTNGCTPSMGASGSASVAATAGFTLAASGVEGQRLGLLFYGVSGRRAAPWGSGNTSLLCVANPIQRMSVANSGGAVGQCNGALSEDWRAWVAARPTALGQPLIAGQLFEAQAWYRDPSAPRGTNVSNGLEFVLRP
jgi:uncharacterized delta-60 repeat protein